MTGTVVEGESRKAAPRNRGAERAGAVPVRDCDI